MRLTELFKSAEPLVENVECGAVADADAVIVAKCDARHCCYTVTCEQLVTEIDGCQAKVSGVYQTIKRTLGLDYFDVVDRAEATVHKLATHIILGIQILDEACAIGKGG